MLKLKLYNLTKLNFRIGINVEFDLPRVTNFSEFVYLLYHTRCMTKSFLYPV